MGGLKEWWQNRKQKKAAKQAAGPKKFGDEHLAQAPQSLGGGTANEVFKVKYQDQHAMNGATGGYFKPHTEQADARNAVASSRLANLFGMSDLIPDTRYAEHDVGGQAKVGAVSKEVLNSQPLMKPVFDQDVTDAYVTKGGMTLDEIRSDPIMAGQVIVTPEGRVMKNSGSAYNNQVDLSNPETQRGLNRLQWFDALTGNVDRHGGNILVDPTTGKVSGIDNDISFGSGVKANEGGTPNASFERGDIGGKYLGLPSLIDDQTAQQILSVSWKDLKKSLVDKSDPGSLSKEELAQAKERLEAVQAKVREKVDDNTLVQQWDNTTFKNMKGESTQNRQTQANYLQRHQVALGHAQAGTPGASLMFPPPPPQQQPQQDAAPKRRRPKLKVPNYPPPKPPTGLPSIPQGGMPSLPEVPSREGRPTLTVPRQQLSNGARPNYPAPLAPQQRRRPKLKVPNYPPPKPPV